MSTLFKSGTDFLCTTGAFQLLKGRFTTLTGQDLNFHPRLGLLPCPYRLFNFDYCQTGYPTKDSLPLIILQINGYFFFQMQQLYSFLEKKKTFPFVQFPSPIQITVPIIIALPSLSRHTRRQTTLLDTNSTVLCLLGRIKGKCTAFCCLEFSLGFKGERVIR